MSNELLLTPREAAERLRCSERKLERHRLAGDGPPFVKFGAAVRYPLDELNAWLAAHLRHSTSDISSAIKPMPRRHDPGERELPVTPPSHPRLTRRRHPEAPR